MAAGLRDLATLRRADVEWALAASPGTPGADSFHPGDPLRPERFQPAAVLCPIVERAEGLAVILIRRSAELRVHAGQIGFPGGRIEAGDSDSLAAALREAEEEIGLPADLVTPAGRLESYRTGTGYEIVPHVGFVEDEFTAQPASWEVAATFEVPLGFLLDPRNRRRERFAILGGERWYDAIPYKGHYIWGATASILKSFADRFAGPDMEFEALPDAL